ncbi:serine hydrolase [Bacillus sp. T33-2]|uniref:serine hydrolase n=1 Tax=Bacillus sp. T33-2 TaxID=2054168 RepID=UPI0015E159FD|nr:serine hydrolase [Bacillus sp. T33-2]
MIEFEESIINEIKKCKGRASIKLVIDNYILKVDSQEPFPSASLIKIPILIAAYRQKELGLLDHQRRITVAAGKTVGGAGVLQALSGNLSYTIKDLLTLMIIVSDNSATNLLINEIGMESINDCLVKLGLAKTSLNRHMMAFAALQQGRDNYTCADDVVECLMTINNGMFLSKDSRSEMLNILQMQQFKDKLPALMDPGVVTTANKTGELPGVQHDCAIIQCNDKTAIVAVLTDQLRSHEDGRQTIRKIGKLVFDFISEKQC